jgi:DNA-binding LacI/PurR family transcriptional regulator
VAITMHDVAGLAGVSIKTVSNVINGYQYIKPETKQRVTEAIEKLGYQPNLSARGLRSGKTGVISLIIPDLRNPYFAELADAVMRAAAKVGLAVLIQQVGGDREAELEALHGPRMTSVDGILYSVLALGEDDVEQVRIPTPMVLLGERIFNGPTDHVTMHNIDGVKAATEHLLARGRTRLLAFGAHPGEVIGSAGLRLTGYRQALEAAGIAYDEQLVVEVGNWHRYDGAAAMREFLASGVDFDGVVAFNDSIALGAMRVMQEAGLRIPEDVAVIGFDDIDETRYTLPTLSTVSPGMDEIAETAVRFLQERISEGAHAIPPREYLSSYRILERESSAVLPNPTVR